MSYQVVEDIDLQFFCFSIVADIFAAAIFSKNSGLFTTYSYTREDARLHGAIRAAQRFEQCLSFLEVFMRPALEAVNAINFYDRSVQNSATELVKFAVTDAIEDIHENKMLSDETKNMIFEKLKSAKLWVMFPDEILNFTKIEGLYNELDFERTNSFNSSLSFIELTWSILSHNRKLGLKPKHDLSKKLHSFVKNNLPTYFSEGDILCEIYFCSHKRLSIFVFFLILRCSSNVDALSLFSSKSFEIFQHGNIIQSDYKKHRLRS